MALSIFCRGATSRMRGFNLKQPTQGFMKLDSSFLKVAPSVQILHPILSQSLVSNTSSPIFNNVHSFGTSAIMRNFQREDTSDHSKLWVIEKAVSIGLLVLVPVSLACPSKALDIAVAVMAVSHIYWGLEAIVVDYVRAVLFGTIIPKVTKLLLIALMIVTVGGLYHLIFHDIGIANTVRRFWAISRNKEQAVL